jgi:hypothetical protein
MTSQASVSVTLTANSLSSMIIHSKSKNTQLPSPESPSTQRSLICPPSMASTSSGRPNSDSSASSAQSRSIQSGGNLIPIQGFVHEVFKRSCTSGSVLQTALCYLEAIQTKVPELVCRKAMGEGVKGETEMGDRIVIDEIEHPIAMIVDSGPTSDFNSELCDREQLNSPPIQRLPPQQQQHQTQQQCSQAPPQWPQDSARKPKPPSLPLPPLPPLPSPLLCPHRAFLASLILASKFTQDKCYSNCAWAKLSGLPPRKIGRCKRALGDALEWRLWVGKSPPSPSPSSAQQSACASIASGVGSASLSAQKSNGHLRTVVRSHSDGDLYAGSKSVARRMHQHQHQAIGMWTACAHLPSYIPTRSYLARSTTLPEGAFGYPPVINRKNGLNQTVTLPSMHTHAQPSVNGSFNSIMGCEPRGPLGGTTTYTAMTNTIMDPETLCSSPNMATPTLTFSLSSTEWSSGDRTIQMTTFIDEPMGSFSTAAPFGPSLKTGNANTNGATVGTNEHREVSPPPLPVGDSSCVVSHSYATAAVYHWQVPTNPVMIAGLDHYCFETDSAHAPLIHISLLNLSIFPSQPLVFLSVSLSIPSSIYVTP